jgi:hypothetical protein
MLLITKINQGVEGCNGNKGNITATPAIPAIRAAKRNVFLAPKRDTAITAITAFQENFGFVEKFHNRHPQKRTGPRNGEPAILSSSTCQKLLGSVGHFFDQRQDGNATATTANGMKFNMSVCQGEQGVIHAHPNILTWIYFGAALANNNVPGQNSFTTVFFDAKAPTC